MAVRSLQNWTAFSLQSNSTRVRLEADRDLRCSRTGCFGPQTNWTMGENTPGFDLNRLNVACVNHTENRDLKMSHFRHLHANRRQCCIFSILFYIFSLDIILNQFPFGNIPLRFILHLSRTWLLEEKKNPGTYTHTLPKLISQIHLFG